MSFIYRMWCRKPRHHRHGLIYAAVVVAESEDNARIELAKHVKKSGNSDHPDAFHDAAEWGCEEIGVSTLDVKDGVVLMDYDTDVWGYQYDWLHGIHAKMMRCPDIDPSGLTVIETLNQSRVQSLIPPGYDPQSRTGIWVVGSDIATYLENLDKAPEFPGFKYYPKTSVEWGGRQIGFLGAERVFEPDSEGWPANAIHFYILDDNDHVLQSKQAVYRPNPLL